MKRYSGSKTRFRKIHAAVGIFFASVFLIWNLIQADSSTGSSIVFPLFLAAAYIVVFRLFDTSKFDIEVDDQHCAGPASLLPYRGKRLQISRNQVRNVQRIGWWGWRWPARSTITDINGNAIHIREDYFTKSEIQEILDTVKVRNT